MRSFSFEGIGTVWNIDVYDEIEAAAFEQLRSLVIHSTHSFERIFSRFSNRSLVNTLSGVVGRFEVPEEFVLLLKICLKASYATHGAFTPLVGGLLSDLGYDKDYSFISKQIQLVPDVVRAIKIINPRYIEIIQPVEFDFGGIGKGYLLDKLVQLLHSKNISNFVIDGGGDIVSRSTFQKTLTIGLEHPYLNNEVIGTITIINKAFCSSSGNRRAWHKHHHIVDPGKGKSSDKILASWVLADTALVADTLSTCLFLAEPEELLREYMFEYLVLNHDLTYRKSDGFDGELYLSSCRMPAE